MTKYRRPWTDDEVDLILDVPRGELSAVADQLDRTLASVVGKRFRLGVGPPKHRWSPSEDRKLDRYVQVGFIQDAAAEVGRSRCAAYHRRLARRAEGEELPLMNRWTHWSR